MTPLLRPGLFLIVLIWSSSGHAAEADGDYLSELAAEAEKVEERVADGDNPEGDKVSGDALPATDTDASREVFERQLQKRYLGSYGFYKRLPERSRQEVFEEYRQGADMEEIRKKIISRLLNR